MILDKLKEMLAEQFDVTEDDILESTDIADDLGADSLDVVELMMAIEDKFGVVIEEEDAFRLRTVGDLATYIEEKA